RHAHRRIPAPVVPLDDVARRELVVGGADLRLDSVDEVEPVPLAARALAGHPADRLDEAAAIARPHVEVRAQQPHDGLPLPDLAGPDVTQRLVAEVARDAQLDAARALLAGPDAAA